MSTEVEGRASYLDLLVATLMEHEKNMDRLIEKLENISEVFPKAYEEAKLKTKKNYVRKEKNDKETDSDELIFMKIKIDRSLDEILKILESLKE